MDTNTLIATVAVALIGSVPAVLAYLQSLANATKADVAEKKLDAAAEKLEQNTDLTSQTKDATVKIQGHTDACTAEIDRLGALAIGHEGRIAALEGQMASLRVSVDALDKSVASSRHEIRGHLQTVVNKLDLLSMAKAQPVVVSPDSGHPKETP